MRYLPTLLIGVFSLFAEERPWVVFYGDQAPITAFDPYHLVVLEPSSEIEVKALRERNKFLLGYLSLGEIEKYRPYFEKMEGAGVIGKENPIWKGSFFADLKNPKWKKEVVEELIPAILQKGYQGIFIDTLDNALTTQKEEAIDLLKFIRMHYPEIPIMVNRAYSIVEAAGDQIDMLLAEDFLTEYDFTTKQYKRKGEEEVALERELFARIRSKYPKLKFYSLDYWNPEDKAEIEALYSEARKEGFNPYVATIELNVIVSEPN